MTTPHGEWVAASCTVPEFVNNTLSVSKESATSNYYPDEKTLRLRCNWEDHRPNPTYYTLIGILKNVNIHYNLLTFEVPIRYDTSIRMHDHLYDHVVLKNPKKLYVSNENTHQFDYTLTNAYDGIFIDRELKGPFYAEDTTYRYWMFQEYVKKSTVYLYTLDEHYYKFQTSLENFVRDDFFTEPSKVYTNIENGYGVFASKNAFALEVK